MRCWSYDEQPACTVTSFPQPAASVATPAPVGPAACALVVAYAAEIREHTGMLMGKGRGVTQIERLKTADGPTCDTRGSRVRSRPGWRQLWRKNGRCHP